MSAEAMAFNLTANDVTGQKKLRVASVPNETTVRELVQGLLARMGLVKTDVAGQPLQYQARLEREGRHLNDSELVTDALQPDDEITLQPRINAGR